MTLDHENMEKKRIRNCKAAWYHDNDGNAIKDPDTPGLRYSIEWYNMSKDNIFDYGVSPIDKPHADSGGCFKDNIFDDRMKNIYAQSIKNILY